MSISFRLALVGAFALTLQSATQAQNRRPKPASMPARPDSLSRLYTYVQYMPLYRGKEGTELLTKDLQREFQAASVAAGCPVLTFPVVVDIIVGPSRFLHDVMILNNMPLITSEEREAGVRGVVGTRPDLQALPAACEAALLAAGRKLPRLNPGSQNGKRVTVCYTLKL